MSLHHLIAGVHSAYMETQEKNNLKKQEAVCFLLRLPPEEFLLQKVIHYKLSDPVKKWPVPAFDL